MKEEIYDLFAASLQDGYIGNLIDIVERAGGAGKLFNMNSEQIQTRLGVSRRMVRHIINTRESTDFEKKYNEMKEKDIKFITYRDEAYPRRLKNISSAPYAIFVKGSIPEEDRKTVAIVGSRQCSEYGRLMAEYFADRLARLDVDIVSGMAWGIDGIAQMAAVNAGGRSYAVLGCGVDVIYPRKNYALYEKLIENRNGVISEYPPGSEALSRKFPPRNRIIAGLCDLLIVVEAREKSGTLITVDIASEQGKTIMVIPGRITDPLSVGCLNLIKEGALPVTGVDCITEELGIETDIIRGKKRSSDNRKEQLQICDNLRDDTKVLTEKEKNVLTMMGVDPITAEDISEKLNMSISETLSTISALERKGLIKELSLGLFVRMIKVN